MKKLAIILSSLLAAITVISTPALAYKCKTPSVAAAFKEAEFVFAGKLKSVSTEKVIAEQKDVPKDTVTKSGVHVRAPKKHYYYKSMMTFDNLKVWKGESDANQVIEFGHDEQDVPFLEQRNYVFFLSKKNEETNRYIITLCSPREDIGLENGYLVTLLLDQITQRGQTNFGVRTPENSFVGAGQGLTDQENLHLYYQRLSKP